MTLHNFNAAEYSILIKQQFVDDELLFVGKVLELPDVAVYESGYQEAYDALLEIISSLKEIDDERGVKFPQPFDIVEEYSGRITLRMPKSLHRQVDFLAIADDVSINQFVVNALIHYVENKSSKKRETALSAEVNFPIRVAPAGEIRYVTAHNIDNIFVSAALNIESRKLHDISTFDWSDPVQFRVDSPKALPSYPVSNEKSFETV